MAGTGRREPGMKVQLPGTEPEGLEPIANDEPVNMHGGTPKGLGWPRRIKSAIRGHS